MAQPRRRRAAVALALGLLVLVLVARKLQGGGRLTSFRQATGMALLTDMRAKAWLSVGGDTGGDLLGEVEPGEAEQDEDDNAAAAAQASYQWSQPAKAGVDMGRLNQCLEKHVRQYYLQEQGLDESMPDVPLFSEDYDNYGLLFDGGAFGTGTTWAVSRSKGLAYLILPKVGSMTFRTQLALCDPDAGVPCDVRNIHGRQYRPEDALMNFHDEAGGFFRSYRSPRRRSREAARDDPYRFQMQHRSLFIDVMKKSLAFTYVTDPIAKFVGGYIQVNKYMGWRSPRRDEAYRAEFVQTVEQMTSLGLTRGLRGNPHFAPQLYYMYNAAIEMTQLAQREGADTSFRAPFQFVGRLDPGHAARDWTAIVEELARENPEAAKLVNRTLLHTNGSVHISKEEKERIRLEAKRLKRMTWLREIAWQEQHLKAKKALGDLAHVDTMPAELVQRFCAAFYTEYVCLGLAFPAPCVSASGEYNVTRFPKHVRDAP